MMNMLCIGFLSGKEIFSSHFQWLNSDTVIVHGKNSMFRCGSSGVALYKYFKKADGFANRFGKTEYGLRLSIFLE